MKLSTHYPETSRRPSGVQRQGFTNLSNLKRALQAAAAMESPTAMSPGDEAAPAQSDMLATQIQLAEERIRAFPPGHPEHVRLQLELPTMYAAAAAAAAAATNFAPPPPVLSADDDPNGTGDPEALPAANQAALEELRGSMTRTAETIRQEMLAVRQDMKM